MPTDDSLEANGAAAKSVAETGEKRTPLFVETHVDSAEEFFHALLPTGVIKADGVSRGSIVAATTGPHLRDPRVPHGDAQDGATFRRPNI